MPLPLLDAEAPRFPHPDRALTDPDGLLAVGGRLDVPTLLAAYRRGIFPWYETGQPILWWSPSRRAVLLPGSAHVSRSMRKLLARGEFRLTTNRAFDTVIEACAAPRPDAAGTWITPQMQAAYSALHRAGYAHSLEVWRDGQLVGGLYGVQVGAVFCGESMYSRASNASKVAFLGLSAGLNRCGFDLIDCQVPNPHLISLGVTSMPRDLFLEKLARGADKKLDWPESEQFAASVGPTSKRG